MTADIDEKSIEKPEELVMALAEAKCVCASSSMLKCGKFPHFASRSQLYGAYYHLVGCDCVFWVVVYEGTIREKPSNKEEARQFIKGYSGQQAATVSSVFVTSLKTGLRKGGFDKVEIFFHGIPDHIVDTLVGTTDSVMGLPKALTERLIKEAL